MPGRDPVVREDGELLGFLSPGDDGWTPLAVFGAPLGPPSSYDDAEHLLRSRGLDHLASPWLLRDGDAWITAQIVEASPERVVVQLADYGVPDRYGERVTLVVPTDRLRPG